MKKINRKKAFLLSLGIAGILALAMVERSTDAGGTGIPDAATAPRHGTEDASRTSILAVDGRSVPDLAAFKTKLQNNLHRVMMLDPSMSDEEMYDFENELVAAAEFDPRARQIMIEELETAFAKKRPSSIYLLERVLQVSEPGRQALAGTYTDMVLAQSEDADFYALQGLKGLQDTLPEKRMAQLFDKALIQLDRYDSFARYSPAMTFAAQAMKDGRYAPNAAQMNDLLGSIGRRQAVATDQQEQFFIAQSLIRMTKPSERATMVEQMLRRHPNRGTFSAVIESIKVGDFEPNDRLMSSMEIIARQLSGQRTG